MKEKKRPHPMLRFLGFLLYSAVLLGSMAFGSLMGWLGQSEVLNGSKPWDVFIPPKPPSQVFAKTTGDYDELTLLILGCDVQINNKHEVYEQRARSDMMMVATLHFNDDSVSALSIPRDLRVDMPGYRPQKINAFHAEGGPELSKRAVEYILPEIQIDRVIVLDFVAFQDMVNMVGGVEVYVPKRMKYDDDWGGLHIDLTEGQQLLDGYEAMGYVRWRKNNPGIGGGDSDLERQKRHHEFMLAMKNRMLERWQTAPKILDKTQDLTGHAFTDEEMKSLVFWGKAVASDNVKMGQLPVVDIPGTYDLAVNQSEVYETLVKLGFIEGTRQEVDIN